MSLREAAQQALEALESLFNWQVDPERGQRCSAAITALRAALAEQKPLEPDIAKIVNDNLWNLYAEEPEQEPLTDEQLEKAYKYIWRNLPDGFSYTLYEYIELGIRYAEKVHGIGEPQ